MGNQPHRGVEGGTQQALPVGGATRAPLIDTHCHLTWPDFDADRDAVIQRAWDAGCTALITIGAGQGMAGNAKAIAVAEQYERIYVAVGLHPHDAKHFTAGTIDELERLAQHPKVVALGEMGLDYHYDFASPEEQHAAFRAQLELAHRLDLPVIIHQREAEADLLRMLSARPEHIVSLSNDEGPKGHSMVRQAHHERLLPFHCHGVVHCFGGSLAFAHQLFDLGLHLGIGGVLTFKKSEALREVVKAVPLDRIVLETDAPYLAPVPYRGKRNEPAYLAHTVEALATTLGRPREEVDRITTTTAAQLFRLPSM